MDEYIEKKPASKSVIITVISFLFIIIVLFYFYYIRTQTLNFNDLTFSKLENKPYNSTLRVNGSFKISSQRVITAKVTGNIVETLINISDSVYEGEALVVMASDDIEKKNQENSIELLKSRSELDKLNYEYNIKLLQLESQLKKSKTELNIKADELSSLKKLNEKGIISTFQFKKAIGNLEKIKVDYEIDKKQLSSHKIEAKNYILNREKIYNKQQKIVQLLKRDYENLTIKSPQKGTILSLNSAIKVGDLVQKGTVLMTVGLINDLDAVLRVPAFQASKLDIGIDVKLKLENKNIKGKIKSISPTVVNQFVEVLVKLSENLPTGIRSDQSLVADINIENSELGLTIPIPEYMYKASLGQNHLYVLDKKLKSIVRKDITVLEVNKDSIVIEGNGLTTGDMILISDNKDLNESIIGIKGYQ